ncbi:MAG: hypothetical protein HRT35_34155 [Algicola sp.]|nr:hypothetical protein [Algicola sp.]
MKMTKTSKIIALIALVCLGSSTGAVAGNKKVKKNKASQKRHDYMMSRVVNKGALDFTTLAADQGGDDASTKPDSTAPIDSKILERLKVEPTITPETTDLLGEQIDLNSGSIGFSQTDISLPGNSNLEVAIRRKFRGLSRRGKGSAGFADWQLDIPSIHTTLGYYNRIYSGSWGDGLGCSGPLNPGWIAGMHNIHKSHQYWNGDTLNVPGHVNDKLLEPTAVLVANLFGNTAGITRVTKSNWRIKCFDRQIPGDFGTKEKFEGFKAYAPDGTIYTFDELC